MLELLQNRFIFRDGDIIDKNTGKVSGTIVRRDSSLEYRLLQFTVNGNKHRCYAHRAAWLLVYGDIPTSSVIDHLDGNGLNNSIDNLRLVSRSINSRNAKIAKNNKSGTTGVIYDNHTHSKKKWRAFIQLEGKRKYLGRFNTEVEAIASRVEAEKVNGYVARKI